MHPIESLCQEYNLTRYALAKMSNITESSLSNFIQRGTKVDNIKVGNIVKIANALDISMDDLYAKLKGYEEK